jgi:hypothetical protein
MARQTHHRADHSRNQAVYLPPHNVPSGYAPNQGSGPPGRPSANQIRTTIRARLYGTSVAPATDLSHSPKRNTQGTPVRMPSGATSDTLANTGSAAGPSGGAYSSRPKGRRIVRSQIAG